MAEVTVTPCCDHAAQLAALTARVAAMEARQPIEPMYTLPESAALLGCSLSTLRHLLTRNRDALAPAVYRWDALHRSHRLLYTPDLRVLRRLYVHVSRRGYLDRCEALAA